MFRRHLRHLHGTSHQNLKLTKLLYIRKAIQMYDIHAAGVNIS